GIANANPNKVGWAAFKLALPGFLFPYIFVYSPAMLMLNSGIVETIYSSFSPALGVFMIATAVEGYLFKPVAAWQRIVIIAASLGLLHVGLITDLVGLGVFIAIAALQRYQISKEAAQAV
ncbi:MAG: C4-dicarboxylate ABC transporter permease, partial [Synergistaceae bacterium]|nr:C4-dicarboxylate ABC transporter permease [Synergistaceae bacterium]